MSALCWLVTGLGAALFARLRAPRGKPWLWLLPALLCMLPAGVPRAVLPFPEIRVSMPGFKPLLYVYRHLETYNRIGALAAGLLLARRGARAAAPVESPPRARSRGVKTEERLRPMGGAFCGFLVILPRAVLPVQPGLDGFADAAQDFQARVALVVALDEDPGGKFGRGLLQHLVGGLLVGRPFGAVGQSSSVIL